MRAASTSSDRATGLRVLLVNFEMDDGSAVLAWQARVARELAARCERVVVLTEKLGEHVGAPNLVVEQVATRPMGVPWRVGGKWFANPRVWQLCREHRIDVCFVHMAHEWAYRLAPALRAARVPVVLWYAHGTVSRRLRLAHRVAARVVTSSPEGFRIPSRKLSIIGQAIDTRLFDVPAERADPIDVLYVGRLSPRKRIERLLEALAAFRRREPAAAVRLRLVGPALGDDASGYLARLRELAARLGVSNAVDFVGFVPQAETPVLYRTAFAHVNVSHTGSMDKTVLEALACGCPVVTSNVAFRELLAGQPGAFLERDEPDNVAASLQRLYAGRRHIDAAAWRSLVVGRHDIDGFMDALMRELTAFGAPTTAPLLRGVPA